MNFADERDTEQKQADDNTAENFGDDRNVVDQTRELNPVMIDESGEDQRGNRRKYDIAIGIRQAEKRHKITGEGVRDTRHAGDELHDHDPSRPKRQAVSGERARPLVGVAGEWNVTSKLSENHRHQKLPGSDDQPTPDKSRPTGAEPVSVIGK